MAVKELQRPSGLPPEELPGLTARIRRDVAAAAGLEHPGATAVLDLVEEAGRPFVVMELVDGTTVQELVGRHGALSVRRAAWIGLDLLAVLRAAHALGVVHGNVHPGGVLVATDGTTKLTGLGTASLPRPPGSGPAGAVLAPERARGGPASAAADVWSVGAVMHNAATGQAPDPAAGPGQAGRAGWLTPVLTRLLSAEAAARPTAAEAYALVEQAISEARRPEARPGVPNGTGQGVPDGTGQGVPNGTENEGHGPAGSTLAAATHGGPPEAAHGGPPDGAGGPWMASGDPAPWGASPTNGHPLRPGGAGRRLRTGLVVGLVSLAVVALAFLGTVRMLGRPAEKRAPSPTVANLAAGTVPTTGAVVAATASSPPTSTVPPTTVAPATAVPPTTVAPTTAPPATVALRFSREAEAGGNTLGGGARIVTCQGCSGGAEVSFVGNGGTLQFNGVTAPSLGRYQVAISYASGEQRSADLSVNGSAGIRLDFAGTGSFDTVGVRTVTVTLRAGPNTLMLSGGHFTPGFDGIRVQPA